MHIEFLVDKMIDGTVPKFGDSIVRTAVRVFVTVGSHIRSVQISDDNFTFHCFFIVTDTSY